MSKYNRVVSLILVGSLVISFLILLFVFQYNEDFCSLLKETSIAIFTGCIFAVPTGIVVLFFEQKKVRNKKNKIISSIYLEFGKVSFSGNQFSLEKLKNHNDQIRLLYEDLSVFLYDNCFNNWKKVNELKDNMFDYSLYTSLLIELYNSTSKDTVDKWCDRIQSKQQECIDIINEIS